MDSMMASSNPKDCSTCENAVLQDKTPTNPTTLQMALQAPIQYNNEMLSG
jgi:hypothetical protein